MVSSEWPIDRYSWQTNMCGSVRDYARPMGAVGPKPDV